MSGNMCDPNRQQNYNTWRPQVDRLSVADDATSCYSTSTIEGPSRSDHYYSPSNIGQRLKSLLDQRLYTDVIFVLNYGKKPKPTFSAHKAILAAGSKKFAEMLYFDDSPTPQKVLQIQINNVPEEAFRSVVEYLYTDDVYFESDESVMQTLLAAQQIELESLVRRCGSYFESAEVNEESVCTKLQLATAHKLDGLKDRCTQFVQDETALVLKSPDFLKSTLSIVRTICKLQKLNLSSESQLFEGLMRWVDAQPRGKVTRRVTVEPLLRNVRFLVLTQREFRSILDKFPDVFSAEEALSILMYVTDMSANKNPKNLPSWCNKGANRCIPAFVNREYVQPKSSRKISFPLKATQKGYLSTLTCILQMKCNFGRHHIEGVRLSFADPVTAWSVIEQVTITVSVGHSNYHFKERLRIENSKFVEVKFSRRLVTSQGSTVNIQAEASGVSNYKFLQFDEEQTYNDEGAFACGLGSIPEANRHFFISEVCYGPALPPPVRSQGQFRGRRPPRRL